jgi:hypothetical protein
MKTTWGLIAASALLLSACADQSATAPAPSGGGSAGAEGEAYCEAPPSNPDDLDNWNQLCAPGDR